MDAALKFLRDLSQNGLWSDDRPRLEMRGAQIIKFANKTPRMR